MEKQILKFVFISVCSFLLFISCSSEDSINDSHYTEQCNVATRYSSVGWGNARCTIKGRTVFIEWNYPTASDKPTGMLFTLYSNFYGYIDSFETFEEEMSGTRSFELPSSFTFSLGDTFWLEIKDGIGFPVTLQLTSINIDEYSGQSSIEPKCDHNFDFRDTSIAIGLDLISGKIEGSIGYTKRCRLIMVYSYYDKIRNKTIHGYRCQDIVDGSVNMPWNDGSYIHSDYYMSDVECELRVYRLPCDKGIPDSYTNFNSSGNCTNYLKATFSFSGSIPLYTLSGNMVIVK